MNKITIRIIQAMILSIDGVGLAMLDEPEDLMKLLEKFLVKLGYKPNIEKMYLDSDLLVLEFDHDGIAKTN